MGYDAHHFLLQPIIHVRCSSHSRNSSLLLIFLGTVASMMRLVGRLAPQALRGPRPLGMPVLESELSGDIFIYLIIGVSGYFWSGVVRP